ncbi:type VII secretion target [Nocardia jiangxiensis]|uniref:Type VII secretion target n=1 Tax=Nocardia jiangxiensis TaxID=282685 RepID=A0ABW6RRR5_9NOCA|nr:type VII secretion target [Nocardia jiangxiensis]
MEPFVTVPDAIRGYGASSASMATTIATVGNVDQAATVGAAVPVFGLIGQDFLAAFAYAQANHISSVNELASVHAGTALAAFTAADHYQLTDDDSAAHIGSV